MVVSMSKWDGTVGKYYYCKVVDAIVKNYQTWNEPRETNTKILLKLLDWFAWQLKNVDGFPDLVYQLEKEKNSSNYFYSEKCNIERRLEGLNEHIASLKIIHEAEIIRLKDIIQAKQIQLDKLLETK